MTLGQLYGLTMNWESGSDQVLMVTVNLSTPPCTLSNIQIHILLIYKYIKINGRSQWKKENMGAHIPPFYINGIFKLQISHNILYITIYPYKDVMLSYYNYIVNIGK